MATNGRSTRTSRRTRERRTQQLFREIGACRSPELREELLAEVVEANLDLCESLARRYANRGLEQDDLMQVASESLVAAVHRYRPDKGEFAAFAIPTITGGLKRYFRDFGWVVRPPRRVQELRARTAAHRGVAEQSRQATLTLSELSEEMGVDERQLAECEGIGLSYRPLSLDAPSSGTDATLGQHLAAEDHDLEALPDILSVREAVAQLSRRDRLVLRWRFADGDTQSQIAQRLGVSQMQVSRILNRILSTMRGMLEPQGSAA